MITLNQYKAINRQHRKTLVFHFGAFAGFYSEYNNMLKAIAFCLVHKIRFVLYSADSCFAKGGWNAFFEPFTDEVTDEFHSRLNQRTPAKPTQTAFFSIFVKRKLKKFLGKDVAPVSYSIYDSLFRHRLLKWKHHFNYFTYELWEDIVHFSLNKVVSINNIGREVEFNGTFYELIYNVDKIIWNYNDRTRLAMQSLFERLNIHQDYIGMHIRGGDKFIEAALINPDDYIQIAKSQEYSDWFLFTDDYSIVESVEGNSQGHKVFTLCQPTEHGYFHHSVMSDDETIKYQKIIRMFASVDICKKASLFIGTKSSNPYFVIDLSHKGRNCISLD